MPKVTFLNEGKTIEVKPGTSILDAAEKAGVKMGHACGGVCACSTCHVWVREGFATLSDQEEREEDILDKAFDVKPVSRLGCQAEVGARDVAVEITPESIKTWWDENPQARREAEERGEVVP